MNRLWPALGLVLLLSLESCGERAAYAPPPPPPPPPPEVTPPPAGPIYPGASLPIFKLPVPRPSAMTVLPRSDYVRQNDTLGTLADRLGTVLDAAGYSERSYFSVPHGFAIATQMERVDDLGRPFSGEARWEIGPKGLITLSQGITFTALRQALLRSDPGHYRLMVLMVTDKPVISAKTRMSSDEARDKIIEGAASLTADFDHAPVDQAYRINVLFYEFKRESVGAPAQFSSPSSVPAALQLSRSGIKPIAG